MPIYGKGNERLIYLLQLETTCPQACMHLCFWCDRRHNIASVQEGHALEKGFSDYSWSRSMCHSDTGGARGKPKML
jgi:hypothetical protein